MKKTEIRLLYTFFIFFAIAACNKPGSGSAGTLPIPPVVVDSFVKGADIGWLPQMEATGFKFYNDNGIAQDCFQILKDHGINTVRLRTWVNPSNDKTSGHCSKDETVALALRGEKNGYAGNDQFSLQ